MDYYPATNYYYVCNSNNYYYYSYSNYWLSRLSSCRLQKSIAASITNRSKLTNGDTLHNPNYQFDEEFILESGFRHY
jgi:hypothetical protein